MKTKESFPKFHKQSSSDTYTIINNNGNSIRILSNHRLVLPILGKIKYRGLKLPINSRIISATVSVSTDNFVAIALKVETDETVKLPESNEYIGIDFGVKTIGVCSDGTIFPKLDLIKELNTKKDFYYGKVSTSVKNSKHNMKWKCKLAKLSRRISNIRKGYCQYIADYLTRRYQIICMEDLSIKDMIKDSTNNHKYHNNINRAITDSGMGMLSTWIEYMCEKRGRTSVKIDRYYPSSQICHSCGYQNPDVKDLTIRAWECPSCKHLNERDLNAALNIRDAGLVTLDIDLSKIIDTVN